MSRTLGLLEAFGIELEYMVVNKDNLKVSPVADKLFEKVTGGITNVVENPRIDWSNELVAHVVEFKNNTPEAKIYELLEPFQSEIKRANKALKDFNCELMSGAMHPFFDPETETRLWPHDNNIIYSTYDRVFGCKGHGWSNLQSLHINISFNTDEEFHKLHSAIRFFLPLVPALSSSSPYFEGKLRDTMSSRLTFYLQNQRRIPSIIGQAIPDVMFSEQDYNERILQPMYRDIAPLDHDNVLQEEWLNSRGAIPKFESGCIEIRLADVQEAPVVDLSVATFWTKAIRKVALENGLDLEKMESIDTSSLRKILDATVKSAENGKIDNLEYLNCFGLNQPSTAQEVLQALFEKLSYKSEETIMKNTLHKLLQQGSLSTRMVKTLNNGTSIQEICQGLAGCLEQGAFFEG